VQVGEIYRVRTDSVYCEGQSMHSRPRVKGRVKWVHPKGRYAVLELSGGHRECYWPEQLTERNRVRQQ
jgi:hypothetical protein